MANQLVIKGGLVANNITGSLLGTASFAQSSVTASHALIANTASFVATASFASTASFTATASYVNNLNQNLTITGSLTTTGDVIVQGDIIAKNYIVSSSVSHFTESFSSGSTRFGDSLDDTHQFTGSISTTNRITSNPTGFDSGLVVNGDSIGAITLKTTGSSGFGIIADSDNGLSIFDVNDTKTRFYMNDGGGFGLNTTQVTGYTLSVSGSSRFSHDVQVTGSVNVVGAVTASALSIFGLTTSEIISNHFTPSNILPGTVSTAYDFDPSKYEGAVVDLVIKSSNGDMRMSSVMMVVNGGGDIKFIETATADIGNTSDLLITCTNNGAEARVLATNNSTTLEYNVRPFARLIEKVSV
jgi:hypothetical protein